MKQQGAKAFNVRAYIGRLLFLLLAVSSASSAWATALKDVSYSVLDAGRVRIALALSGTAPEVGSFTTDNPARIAIDLPSTELALQQRFLDIDAGPARSLRAVQAGDRTRVVLALTHLVPYEIDRDGNQVYVTLGAAPAAGTSVAVAAPKGSPGNAPETPAGKAIKGVDFRRGPAGEGRVVVNLDPGVIVDMRESTGKILIDFLNAKVPAQLERRLNVVDFATPVKLVDVYNTDSGARMVVDAKEPYEHLAYQTGDVYTLEIQQLEVKDDTPQAGGKGGYSGERLSLNFQNIEVRAVLQLIADFTGLNVVASDTVSGTITLRLKNVPWDQALDIILKTKGLGMRQTGNVVLIAPNEEIAAREKQELQAQQQLLELVPLRTQYFQVNYAKASEVASLMKGGEGSILSERGSVSIDSRTNMLMVSDTAESLEQVARVIEKLDVPIRQVLIESRIVIANDDFSRSLGVRAGFNGYDLKTDQWAVTSGSLEGAQTIWDSAGDAVANGDPVAIGDPSERLNVNLPTAAAGRIALAFLTGDYIVDLELSALQQEGRGEVISNPRVVTANQQQATIQQGVQIPYQEASASGATSTSFKDAVLSLSVTPQITPDERVIMDLQVNKDSVGQIVGGVPTINTRSVQTQVLVNNGDTVVLGGIYEQTSTNSVTKVPLLGDIPLLGHLFRRTAKTDDKNELLIFITPKILKDGLTANLQ